MSVILSGMKQNKITQNSLFILQKIGQAIARRRDVNVMLTRILEIIQEELGMERGAFLLYDDEEFHVKVARGLSRAELSAETLARVRECMKKVIEKEKKQIIPAFPIVLEETAEVPAGSPVLSSFIGVPLRRQRNVIGVLAASGPVRPTEELEAITELFNVIASMAAEAAFFRKQIHKEKESLLSENQRLRGMLNQAPGQMIGNCEAMKRVYEQIRQVAPSDATVLIRGASGTGKELVARAIVELSPRKEKPFVIVNCAALPEPLLESELFGHEKGAFTGAAARRIGRVEAANGGTIFLDEIGDLSPSTQVKLLRLIQNRTFSRLGSNGELHADVRFLAATSQDLEELMVQKRFRSDLFYRLNVFPIRLPDLCKRQGDILMLARHFVDTICAKYGKKINHISPAAVQLLMGYAWPGNVRELENCMEYAVLTANEESIRARHLPLQLQTAKDSLSISDGSSSLEFLLANFEREVLLTVLRKKQWNRAAAAKELGISPRMMTYRANRLGIPKREDD